MNIGSIWRKWDLHVHTKSEQNYTFASDHAISKREQNDDEYPKVFIEKIYSIENLGAIAITDHNKADWIDRIIEENQIFVSQNNYERITIFPGVEIESSDGIHLLVIFNPDSQSNKVNTNYRKTTWKETIEHFLTAIGITQRSNSSKTTEEIMEEAEKWEALCIFAHVTSDKGFFRISSGSSKTRIYKHMLTQIFQKSLNTSLNDGQNNIIKGLDPQYCDDKYNPKSICCITASDAKSLVDIGENNLWIKADPTFEGLKQIIYESEERVRIQPENPEYRKNIHTLDLIKISNSWINDELSIEEQEISLNRNLIAVTGGKGSGKTALLDLIANCFEDRRKRAGEDRNSFVQRIEDQKQDLEVKIGFIGEDVEEFFKELVEEKFFQDSKIIYLPQGKIEEYSGDRQKLDKKIEEIIFSNKEVIDGGYKQKFDELRDEIDEITKQIDKINREIYELEEDTKEEIITEITSRKRIKEGELKDKEDELGRLTESMEEGIKESIEKLKREEIDLRVKHSKFENVKTYLEQFKDKLEGFLDDSNNTINDLNHELSELRVDQTIPQLNFKPQLDAIQKALELIPQRIEDITKQIEMKKEVLSQLSGVEKAHAELLKEIDIIKTDVGALEQQLKELEKKKEKVESLESDRIEKYKYLLSKYWEWREYYKEVINAFTMGKSKIMGGIDFKASIYFDKSEFIELGTDILDQRKINIYELEKCAELLETAITENTLEKLVGSLNEFTQKIFENKKFLRGTRTSYDFYKWTFGNYFSLSTEIFFKQISMDKLSMGQKGTVLLKLFLAEGDYPLIVDQPEESLDNKFIYGELVGAFREAKKKRQIIIATNNANLVVNTDAEQIIVAEFKNNKISYKLGALEDLKMRGYIMPILEGGKEAFRKRERKYGI